MLCRLRNCVFRLPRHDLKITSTDGEEVTRRTWQSFRLPFFGAECWVWSRGSAKWFYRFSRQPHRNPPKGLPSFCPQNTPAKLQWSFSLGAERDLLEMGVCGGRDYISPLQLALTYVLLWSVSIEGNALTNRTFFLNPGFYQETWNHLRHYDFPLELCWFSLVLWDETQYPTLSGNIVTVFGGL